MRRRLPASPDEVSERFASRKVKLVVQELDGDPGRILIETDRAGFEFLGQLFLAHARTRLDCDFSLGPIGPGAAWFSAPSTRGFYLHRLPCTYRRGFRMAVKPKTAKATAGDVRKTAAVKFGALLKRAARAWPESIPIADGRRIRFRKGVEATPDTVPTSWTGEEGHYFPALSKARSDAETQTENAPEPLGLMTWTLFQELHAEARRRLEAGQTRRRLRVADLDRSAIAVRPVRNLSVRGWTKGWKAIRKGFLQANPDLETVTRRKRR